MAKVAIITGADGCMGQEEVLSVARAGYEVVMACRNPQKAWPVCKELIAKTHNATIRVIRLDLASFASIHAFVEAFREVYDHVDLLMNNAGTLLHHADTTDDGVERTVGVNYLGHYVLTRQLLPIMPAGSRIVSMVSLTFRFGHLDHDIFSPIDQKHFNRFATYSDSKLALLYFTLDLAEELKERGITVNCADPGIVSTNIIRQGITVIDKLCDIFFRPIIYKPAKGASTLIYLALDPDLTVTGRCFAHKKPVKLRRKVIESPWRPQLREQTDAAIRKITERLSSSAATNDNNNA
ncbi:MAG: SDR family NAD(P)-dependent oxidoreductase [Bacteroidales bacterium]|nr:SDR family NAD(P)-dependent oxidoreductase [Bacteroidales bacterium]